MGIGIAGGQQYWVLVSLEANSIGYWYRRRPTVLGIGIAGGQQYWVLGMLCGIVLTLVNYSSISTNTSILLVMMQTNPEVAEQNGRDLAHHPHDVLILVRVVSEPRGLTDCYDITTEISAPNTSYSLLRITTVLNM